MTILELQRALTKAGFNPGPIDGISGPKTRAAVRAFQQKHGLEADGIAGPKTMAKLFGLSGKEMTSKTTSGTVIGDVPADMPWLAEAKRLIGTTEVAGPGNSPAVMAMANAPDIAFANDETPWCGLFIAHCVASTLPDEPLPANPLGARQWTKFGKPVDPQFGSVLVFWRGSPSGWMGHVGFYWAEDDLHYHVLGGNQSNSVNVSRMTKSRLLGATWPQATDPAGIRRMANGAGITITTNEQ